MTIRNPIIFIFSIDKFEQKKSILISPEEIIFFFSTFFKDIYILFLFIREYINLISYIFMLFKNSKTNFFYQKTYIYSFFQIIK